MRRLCRRRFPHYSTLIIGLVQVIRAKFASVITTDRSKFASGQVVFSLEDNQAWAGWHGHKAMVQLGSKDDVAEMMEDFLAQLELAERLESSSLRQNSHP